MGTILGAWVATALTLFIFSFLYKDNRARDSTFMLSPGLWAS
jgi:hypothetical protein